MKQIFIKTKRKRKKRMLIDLVALKEESACIIHINGFCTNSNFINITYNKLLSYHFTFLYH